MFAALVKANKGTLKADNLTNNGDETQNGSAENLDSLLVHSRHNLEAQHQQQSVGRASSVGRNGANTPSGGLLQQQQAPTLPQDLAQVFQPVEWDPEIYGVGVRSIDEQHQQLIANISKLCSLGKAVALHKLQNNATNTNKPLDGGRTLGGSNKTGNTSSGTAGSPPGSPTNKFNSSVTSPMTLRGALGMDFKNFEEENEKNNSNNNQHHSSAMSKRRSLVAMDGGGEDSLEKSMNNNDYNHIRSSNHVFGHRVTLAEGACRTVDRGHPPDLQKGGRVEPLIEALVVHCSMKLIQEEHALEAVSFSDRGPHAAEHQIFVREAFRAHHLVENYNFEMSDLIKLIKFLKGWLKDHIPKDRRYAPLMLEKQSSLAAGKV